MSNRTVSVIMPSFNSAPFIGDSIESVLSQTRSDLELLIVDDASKDNTCEVVQRYAQLDPRIRLISLTKNAGPAAARNAAIEAAMGRYVAFLDSDDSWSPNKLSVQIPTMDRCEAPLSCTAYTMLKSDGSFRTVTPPRIITPAKLLSGTDVGCLTVVVDYERIGRKLYMPYIRMRHDMLLWVNIIQTAGPGIGIENDLATLHIRSQSLTHNKLLAVKYQWIAYRTRLDLSLIDSVKYFTRYAFHGLQKYRFEKPRRHVE